MNEAAVAPALGVSLLTLYQLQRNAQFPAAVGGLWDSGAISAFASLMASALANWPSLTSDSYAAADWELLAVTRPGPYANSPGGLMGGSGSRQGGIYGSGVYGKGGLFE